MTRLSTFWLGLALGAAIVVALFIFVRSTPHLRVSVDWEPPGYVASPSTRVAATTPSPTSLIVAPVSVARASPTVTAPVAPAMLLRALVDTPANTDVEPPQQLLIPVAGVKASQLVDTFADARGSGRVHDAIDIMAPRGTPVLAVSDGKLVKFFDSRQGGLTIYQFDPSQTYAYYYAHLDAYAPGLQEGSDLKRGQVIGRVGSTGNASPDAPHLHFAIFVLGPERN